MLIAVDIPQIESWKVPGTRPRALPWFDDSGNWGPGPAGPILILKILILINSDMKDGAQWRWKQACCFEDNSTSLPLWKVLIPSVTFSLLVLERSYISFFPYPDTLFAPSLRIITLSQNKQGFKRKALFRCFCPQLLTHLFLGLRALSHISHHAGKKCAPAPGGGLLGGSTKPGVVPRRSIQRRVSHKRDRHPSYCSWATFRICEEILAEAEPSQKLSCKYLKEPDWKKNVNICFIILWLDPSFKYMCQESNISSSQGQWRIPLPSSTHEV